MRNKESVLVKEHCKRPKIVPGVSARDKAEGEIESDAGLARRAGSLLFNFYL
jgi:hypothetical protein